MYHSIREVNADDTDHSPVFQKIHSNFLLWLKKAGLCKETRRIRYLEIYLLRRQSRKAVVPATTGIIVHTAIMIFFFIDSFLRYS